jgi:probable F420-dependent oxidoreductase
MAKPFRFAVQVSSLPTDGWIERVRGLERMGFSSVFCPDHFGPQWDPTALLAAAAAVTTKLNVGSLVYDVDYRHPVIHAKGAATIQLLSGGRHEFGIGAGWMQTDYDEAGMTYDSPGTRISRLDEALQIITSMWANERTSFSGKHYKITNIAKAAELPAGSRPRILIGGGGPRVLRLAGKYADIVGINPTLVEGKVTPQTITDLLPEKIDEKLRWVREGAAKAGRNPNDIELNALTFVTAISDDPKGLRTALAGNSGMTPQQVAESPMFLTGPASEIRDGLEKRRERYGFSYIVIQGRDWGSVEQFAEKIVAPLAGK